MRIETERLLVKPMTCLNYKDFSEIVTDFRDGEYSKYNPPLPQTKDEVKEFFYGFLENIDTFGIYLNKEMIGLVTVTSDYDQLDIGYMFKDKYHGYGYAYEGTKAVIDLLIEQFGQFDAKITAGVASENIPSVKLLDKLGFKCKSKEEISFVDDFVIESCNYVLQY